MTPPTPDTLTVLDFLAEHGEVHPGTVAALIRLGAGDPLAAAAGLDAVAAGQVRALAATWGGPWPGDLAHLLTIIGDVGARVVATDPELLPEWAQVADRVRTLARGDLRRVWRPQLPDAVTAFCDAGRGPAYANDMLDAAAHAGVAPDAFGYGPQVTGALLGELAAAGIRTAADLAEYCALGLDVADAMRLATEKVGPRAAAWATAVGVPRAQWAGTLAGLPDHWFPSPGGEAGDDDLISRGFTVDDLRFLLEHGWGSLHAYDLGHALLRGKHAPRGTYSREQVLQVAAVASREDLSRWFEALTSGKPGSTWRSPALPPLIARWSGVPAVAEQAARLVAAGVKPSHLGPYRAAGARSVDDVLTAVDAGITPARAKHLIEVAGQRADQYSPLRLASMADLLAAHARTPVG